MSETPFLETEILLAMLNGDEDRVSHMLYIDMNEYEREKFIEKLERICYLASDFNICPKCEKLVEEGATHTVDNHVTGYRKWHTPCFAVSELTPWGRK